MSGSKTLKQKTKVIPVNLGDLIIGMPLDIGVEKFDKIFKPHLVELGLDKDGSLDSKIHPFLEELSKSDSKFLLVSQMIEAFSDVSQDLVDKASIIKGDEKIILHILARNVSALGAAQLLFNYAYFIEFITVLRMIFEQCGYVVSWIKKSKKPSKGPQSIQISEFHKEIPSATIKLYGELCETAHLNIYKPNKVITVSNDFEKGDSLVVASKQKTLENYHIFHEVFNVLVETTSYVVNCKFSDDKKLLKYLEVLLLNKECIDMISETGTLDEKKILTLFPNALDDAINGFSEQQKEEIIKSFGSLDNYKKQLKEKIESD